MSKYRNLDRGDVLPASWTDALQEFISTAIENVRLTTPNTTTVRVAAAVGSGMAAVGIEGLWRYRSTNIDATVSGVTGIKDVFVTATANVFSSTPQPDTDTTDYNFGLQVLTAGTFPVGTAGYRKIGEVDWNGTAITGLRQSAGMTDGTLPLTPTASLAAITPLSVRGIASQSAPLIGAGSSAAANDRMLLNAAGQLQLPVPGSGGGILLGADVNLYRQAADVLRTDDSLQVGGSLTVTGAVAASNTDGPAATPSLRTLGPGAAQAAPGNDPRLSDTRAPTGTASGDLSGTYPSPQIAAGVVVDADVNAAAAIAESKLALASDAAVGVASRRTLGAGAQQAMPGNRTLDAIPLAAAAVNLNSQRITGLLAPSIASDAIRNDDARLTNSRAPTAHAASHQPGGGDAMAVDAVAGTGSLRTLGIGAAQAAAGNDTRFPAGADIVDADVGAAAAIARSKLNFGTGLVNADLAPAAAIARTKLDFGTGLVNADLAAAAAVARSKLDFGAGLINTDIAPTAAIAYAKLMLTNGIVNGDINAAAAIAYAKLNLAGSVVNADIATAAAIAYSKLNLAGSIVNADVAAAAAIAWSKINSAGAIYNADVNAAAAIAKSKLAPLAIVDADVAPAAAIAWTKVYTAGVVVNSDVSGTAAIAESKLALASDAVAGTASRRSLGTGATQAAAGNDARFPAGADIVDADVGAAAAIAESKLNLASDAAPGTASRRSLGTGANQAARGNDARFTVPRTYGDMTTTFANGTPVRT